MEAYINAGERLHDADGEYLATAARDFFGGEAWSNDLFIEPAIELGAVAQTTQEVALVGRLIGAMLAKARVASPPRWVPANVPRTWWDA